MFACVRECVRVSVCVCVRTWSSPTSCEKSVLHTDTELYTWTELCTCTQVYHGEQQAARAAAVLDKNKCVCVEDNTLRKTLWHCARRCQDIVQHSVARCNT